MLGTTALKLKIKLSARFRSDRQRVKQIKCDIRITVPTFGRFLATLLELFLVLLVIIYYNSGPSQLCLRKRKFNKKGQYSFGSYFALHDASILSPRANFLIPKSFVAKI